MNIEKARGIYEQLIEKYENKLAACGANVESEIYFEDEEWERTESESKFAYISLDLNVFTDNIDNDNGICFVACAEIKKGKIDDDELLTDAKTFEEAINKFIDDIGFCGDIDSIILRESKKAEEEAEEEAEKMLAELEGKIKKTNTIAAISVGICVLVAAIALIVHFLT